MMVIEDDDGDSDNIFWQSLKATTHSSAAMNLWTTWRAHPAHG